MHGTGFRNQLGVHKTRLAALTPSDYKMISEFVIAFLSCKHHQTVYPKQELSVPQEVSNTNLLLPTPKHILHSL
jgi:hypothetical protein